MRFSGWIRRALKLTATPLAGAGLALLPPLLPQPGSPPPPPQGGSQSGSLFGVRVSTTGNQSERVERLPIARRPHGRERVVMSLGPDKLPPLTSGTRLGVTAEVQVSTTCVEPGSNCIGRRYRFSPNVSARIVLAAGPKGTRGGEADPISKRRSVRCSQSLPNRNHHCVIVFRNVGERIGSAAALPCDPSRCHINLTMRARHPRSRKADVVVVGGDRPGGRIVQDKGRLNAVVMQRGASPSTKRRQTHGVVSKQLPLNQPGPESREVVASIRMKDLNQGDRLVVYGRHVTSLGAFDSNAYVGSELILSTHRRGTRTRKLARRSGILSGRISEANGFNCTLGPSAFADPCTTEKVGVMHVKRSTAEAGRRRPLFVNLVARALPLRADADPGDRVTVRSAMVKLIRYRGR